MAIDWSKRVRLPELNDLEQFIPGAHIETVGPRAELVIYTGWTLADDGQTLIPMGDDG